MNINYFVEQIQDFETNSQNDLFEVPFLECMGIHGLNDILLPYYSQDFETTIHIATQALAEFEDDCGLYHIVACALHNLREYKKASYYFDFACKIINSYHAIYHFIGYTLHYNRATLHHIMGNFDLASKDLSKAQFLYHQNNPNRDTPLQINEEKLHFKNPTKDMLPPQKTISHLSIFKESSIEANFWYSLQFFEKRQWYKCLSVCNKLIDSIANTHLEYHYFSACMFYNRAINHITLGNTGQAIDDLSRAISFDAKNPRNDLYKSTLKSIQARQNG